MHDDDVDDYQPLSARYAAPAFTTCNLSDHTLFPPQTRAGIIFTLTYVLARAKLAERRQKTHIANALSATNSVPSFLQFRE